MKSENEILRNVIKQMLNPIKDIPLNLVIESISDNKVLKFEKNIQRKLTKILKNVAEETIKVLQSEPIKSNRINEVGNKIETTIENTLNKYGLNAGKPITKNGKIKSSGYPDLKFTYKNIDYYIECKTYNEKSKNSSLRSFYLSPSNDFKVISDGYHLIFAFQMETINKFSTATSWKIVDAYNLLCDVKYEFNSNNKKIYNDCEIIAEG